MGTESNSGSVLAFGDKEGHIGTFEGVGGVQSEQGEGSGRRSLEEDSLLMEVRTPQGELMLMEVRIPPGGTSVTTLPSLPSITPLM